MSHPSPQPQDSAPECDAAGALPHDYHEDDEGSDGPRVAQWGLSAGAGGDTGCSDVSPPAAAAHEEGAASTSATPPTYTGTLALGVRWFWFVHMSYWFALFRSVRRMYTNITRRELFRAAHDGTDEYASFLHCACCRTEAGSLEPCCPARSRCGT